MDHGLLEAKYGRGFRWLLREIGPPYLPDEHLDYHLRKRPPFHIDARAPANTRGIRAPGESFAEDCKNRLIKFVKESRSSAEPPNEPVSLRDFMQLKSNQSGFRWNQNEAKYKRAMFQESNRDRGLSGAAHLDIFTWNSGESRGFHYLDDFRTGAWLIGIAQEADDSREPGQSATESFAESTHPSSSTTQSTRWADFLEEEEDEDEEEAVRRAHELFRKAKPQVTSQPDTDEEAEDEAEAEDGAYWAEWSHDIPRWRDPRWIKTFRAIPEEWGGDGLPKEAWLLREPNRYRRESRADRRRPILNKSDGYCYDQAAYIEGLGFNVISKDGNMVYVRSHACQQLTLLESDTIRTQVDETKWDMCRPWQSNNPKHKPSHKASNELSTVPDHVFDPTRARWQPHVATPNIFCFLNQGPTCSWRWCSPRHMLGSSRCGSVPLT